MKNLFTLSIVASFLLFSCQSETADSDTETEDNGQRIESTDCQIVLETQAVMLKWTAFKFTEKTAVGGKFDQVSIKGPQKGKDWRELALNSAFAIRTSSINSENPERDEKIGKYFFGNLVNGGAIDGLIIGLDGSEFEGQGEIELDLNGMKNVVPCSYFKSENLIVFTGTLDLVNWDGQTATDSLNQICYDLHKGADGISKLWTEVGFEVQIPYGYDCN
jgi:hypothetical protein